MLRLPAERLSPGMIVGQPIIDAKGRVLLTTGQVLNERYIKRIKEMELKSVYIEDQMGIGDSPALLNPALISRATKTLKNSYEECAKTGKANLTLVQSQIDNIIDDLLTNNNLLIGISDIKSHDEYTYQHSINVCILAIILGMSNGYKRAALQTLGTGALLHDIGKINIPLEILNKPGSLTDEEYSIVKKHSLDGYNMIRNSSKNSSLSANIALLHHERVDGRGYPRGLAANNIHEYGLIVAVADIFDALVSDRPYRRGFNNHEAMQIVEKSRDTQLAPKFVDILSQHVNIYPNGTVVTLSTGDIAVVAKENPQNYGIPKVKLLFSANQQIYNKNVSIDLNDDRTISISSVLSPVEAEKNICLYLSLQNNPLSNCAG